MPDLRRMLALEAMLDEALSRLPSTDLEAVLNMNQTSERTGHEWPNETTELFAALIRVRCGMRLE